MIDPGTPDYLPFELDPASGRVSLLRLTEAEYRAASFLDQRVLRPDSALIETEWGTLALPDGARRDVQYIFHIGNVGSTLISRLLGELDGVFALREPLLLRSFAASPPGPEDFDRLTALLSRTYRPEQRANVKATSFTSELADRLVPPGSKALFLYARPDRYLENILGPGRAGREGAQQQRLAQREDAVQLAEQAGDELGGEGGGEKNFNLDQIMAGQLDPLIGALLDLDKQQRLEAL